MYVAVVEQPEVAGLRQVQHVGAGKQVPAPAAAGGRGLPDHHVAEHQPPRAVERGGDEPVADPRDRRQLRQPEAQVDDAHRTVVEDPSEGRGLGQAGQCPAADSDDAGEIGTEVRGAQE